MFNDTCLTDQASESIILQFSQCNQKQFSCSDGTCIGRLSDKEVDM